MAVQLHCLIVSLASEKRNPFDRTMAAAVLEISCKVPFKTCTPTMDETILDDAIQFRKILLRYVVYYRANAAFCGCSSDLYSVGVMVVICTRIRHFKLISLLFSTVMQFASLSRSPL